MNRKIKFGLAIVRQAQVSMQAAIRGLGYHGRIADLFLFADGEQPAAQVNTGSLSGLVLDSSGAAVAGTELTVTSAQTGYSRTSKSLSDGAYSLPDLPIGDYTLDCRGQWLFTGSGKDKNRGGERIRLDVHLAVGAAIRRRGQCHGLELQRDDASIGTLVTSDVIEETPLYLRNWDDLLRVVPGVQIARYTNQSGATSAGRTGDFNVKAFTRCKTTSSWTGSTTIRFRKTYRN